MYPATHPLLTGELIAHDSPVLPQTSYIRSHSLSQNAQYCSTVSTPRVTTVYPNPEDQMMAIWRRLKLVRSSVHYRHRQHVHAIHQQLHPPFQPTPRAILRDAEFQDFPCPKAYQ